MENSMAKSLMQTEPYRQASCLNSRFMNFSATYQDFDASIFFPGSTGKQGIHAERLSRKYDTPV